MPASRRLSLVAALVTFSPFAAACGDAGGGSGDATSGSNSDGGSDSDPSTSNNPGDPTTSGASDDGTNSSSDPTQTSNPSSPTSDPSSDPTQTTDPSATDSSATDTATDTTDTADSTGTTGDEQACEPMLPTFADGKTPSKTLHVKAGAAPGGDGSEAKPFDKLQQATGVATPGTEIRISGDLPGLTYTDGLKGTADAPIWFTGEPGAKIGALTLQNASHIIVQDLEMANPAVDGHVLHFFFADHIMMRRLKIHECGQGCIKGSQTTDAYVEDSELWNAGQFKAHPVLDYVGVNTGHIVRSDFHDGPGVIIMLKGGTSDLFFAWNQIHDQTAPGDALSLGQWTGPEFFQPIDEAFEGVRIVAFANLLHDLVGPPVSFVGCKDCAAVRNTIWATTGNQLVRFLPGSAGMDSGVETSLSQGSRFTGNIVVGGQPNGASLNADAPNTGPDNKVDYNVFLKPGNLNWWGVIPQDLEHSTFDQDPQLDAGGVPANLALVDGKGPPDLAGLPFADLFTRDAAGACTNEPPDIGAFDVP